MLFFSKKVNCECCNKSVSIKECRELKSGYICNNCVKDLIDKNIINEWFLLKKMTMQDIQELIEKENTEIEIYPIINPSLVLKDGEICYYCGDAESFNIKNVITHYKQVGAYTGFRIMKGVTIGGSQGERVPIREDIEERFPAKFYITNKRIVLIADKFGFDLDINKISSVEQFRNGFKYTYKEKPRYVLTNDYKYIARLCSKLATILQ